MMTSRFIRMRPWKRNWLDDTVAADISTTQDLYIIYTATLNGKAINSASGISIADTTNTTKITFGNNSSSEPDSTTTTTHKFSVFKHAKDETTNLAGAEFQLKKGSGTEAVLLAKRAQLLLSRLWPAGIL